MTSADIDGIDISHWQNGVIDYAAAKKAGVKFVYHKATEGESYRDPNYARRREEARKVGIPFGAYHFARPDGVDATKEAEWFLNVAQPKPGDMIPVLDFEVSNSLTREQMSKWVETFVSTVKKRGFKVMIYTPFSLNSTYGCPLWVARYSNAMYAPRIPAPWTRYDLWQFSDGKYGSPNYVPGVGYVDINTMHPECSLTSIRVPQPTPAPTPVPPPAPPTAKSSEIRIMHASMQFSDSAAQMRSDVEKIFALGQDAVTFTEAHHTNALHKLIPEIGKKHGYEVYAHKYGLAVAVKKSYATKLSTGYASGINGSREGDRDVYSPRGVAWMAVRTKTNEIITVSVTHYITKGRTPRDGFRYYENLKIARAVGRLAKWGGKGTKLFFCNGDMNLPDKVNDVFHGQPLTTCWDELKKWPDTGHGNIDVIASYDPDSRVSCVDAFVFDDKRLPLHTDHYMIFAKYKIKGLS